ncbi:MAG: UvrD-helicase domain-containing protein, partial [Anaerolineae bacterium]|nr:UvrD-helicase domain-containing protein [Anaerolineae bacterium]
MELLSGLNPQQRAAVSAGEGPVLVLAGPGSGKTRVLTHRIAYLVNQMGVSPYHILAVTFTNKAAREMQTRLEKLLDRSMTGVWLGTFHAVCAKILRREQANLPFTSSFVIFDADDQVGLIKRAMKELNLDEKLYKPTGIHAAISSAKNNLQFPADYPTPTYKDEVTARVYKRYQELLLASNAVDFDDLLLYTWKLLDDNPAVRESYSRRFEHVLVDEFQDTNMVQYELLRRLVSVKPNIFVVGDEDQSIYRWRGADYRNVLRFEEDYANSQKILLEQNYRSTQTVLDAAQAVIDKNRHRTPKKLRSMPELGTGEKLSLYEAVDDYGEAAYVVDTIQTLTQSKRARLGDFAVMYRTNAQSRLLEEAFLRAGLPYRLVGAMRFYGRREIKDLIAYLRLVQNPSDEVSLGRVINVPARGIGDKAQTALSLTARQAGISTGQVVLDLAVNGKDSPHWEPVGRPAPLLADFGAMLAGWRQQMDTMPLPALFGHMLEDLSYESFINDGSEEGRSRWENVEELRRLTYEYEDSGLTTFLENMALVSDQDTVREEAEAPTLLTLHAAKGLEFPMVFITGLDDGTLPHNRSLDDPEEMAEERRLFYVGITRAKLRVFLVRAAQRSTFGSFQESIPSRFLDDIPAELLSEANGSRRGGRRSESSASTMWESRTLRTGNGSAYAGPAQKARPNAAPIVQARYRAGMRINHATWGEGLVVDIRIQDNDATV